MELLGIRGLQNIFMGLQNVWATHLSRHMHHALLSPLILRYHTVEINIAYPVVRVDYALENAISKF